MSETLAKVRTGHVPYLAVGRNTFRPNQGESSITRVFSIVGNNPVTSKNTLRRNVVSSHSGEGLIRSRWADTGGIEVDEAAGEIRVPVRRQMTVSTADAKQTLEQSGFTIGKTTFKSNATDAPEDTTQPPGSPEE